VCLDQEEEIFGVLGERHWAAAQNLDLCQLIVGDTQGFVSVVAVVQDDLQKEVAGPCFKLLDFGWRGEEGSGNALTSV
jgi:hypothetical protein